MTARGGLEGFLAAEKGRSMLPASRGRQAPQVSTGTEPAGRVLARAWHSGEQGGGEIQANGAAGLAGAHSASRMARRQLPRCRRKGFAPRSRGFRQGMLHAEHDAPPPCSRASLPCWRRASCSLAPLPWEPCRGLRETWPFAMRQPHAARQASGTSRTFGTYGTAWESGAFGAFEAALCAEGAPCDACTGGVG